MDQVSIVGLDRAKRVFQVHGADADGRVLFRKKLSRGQLLRNHPAWTAGGAFSEGWRRASDHCPIVRRRERRSQDLASSSSRAVAHPAHRLDELLPWKWKPQVVTIAAQAA